MPATGLSRLGPSPKLSIYSDQGAYYVATNPTPGTGIISGVVTSLADTTPLLIVKNNNAVASGVKVQLDRLMLRVTVVGAGGTLRNVTLKTDTSQSVTRYTSGGTTITPVATSSVAPGTNTQVFFGAITAAAAGAARIIGNFALREVIEVVEDTYLFDFGPSVQQPAAALPTGGTLTVARYFAAPPITIGPQEHFLAHYWSPSLATGTTFEFNLGYIEV